MERQVPVLAANRPKFIREALVSQPFEFILKKLSLCLCAREHKPVAGISCFDDGFNPATV